MTIVAFARREVSFQKLGVGAGLVPAQEGDHTGRLHLNCPKQYGDSGLGARRGPAPQEWRYPRLGDVVTQAPYIQPLDEPQPETAAARLAVPSG
jgi:hypothetical protein